MCLCVLGQDVLPGFSPRPTSTQPGNGLRGVRGSSQGIIRDLGSQLFWVYVLVAVSTGSTRFYIKDMAEARPKSSQNCESPGWLELMGDLEVTGFQTLSQNRTNYFAKPN